MENNLDNKILLKKAISLVKLPIIISLFLTPLRFSLELIGINENYIFFIGLLWLTLAFSIYWAIRHYKTHLFLIILLLSLIIYSPISRIPVAIVWWIDTHWALGTHYGMYFDTFTQVLLNHVFYGSLVQIIPGFLIGLFTFAIMQQRQTLKFKNKTSKNG